MERKDYYDFIKKNNLNNEIKATFGDSYTRVSNENLAKFYEKYNKAKKVQNAVAKAKNPTADTVEIVTRLIEILKKKNILLKSEVEFILFG